MSQKKKTKPQNNKNMSKKAKKQSTSDRVWTAIMIIVCVALIGLAIYAVLPEKAPETPKVEAPKFDELSENQYYFATIEVYDYGTIKVQLDHKEAPITVANFVKLAKDNFYEGLTFHRIVEGFMMQGGRTSIPEKMPEAIVGEFSSNGYENNISHKRGVISMARSGNNNDSASSQFFIMHKTNTNLDGYYAAFGYVVEGLDVVDMICENAEPTDDNGTIDQLNQPVIENITISIETVS